MSPYSLLAHLLQRRIPLHARAFLFGGKSSKQNCRRVTASQCAWASCSACHPCKAACCKVSFSDCLVASSGKNWEENKQLKKKFRPLWDQSCQQPGWWRGRQVRGMGASSPVSSSPRLSPTRGSHPWVPRCLGVLLWPAFCHCRVERKGSFYGVNSAFVFGSEQCF